MQQQLVALVQAAMQGDQQASQQIQQVMQAAQQGDQQAAQIAQMIQQIAQQLQGGRPSAKYGAKLNYIKYLRGECPDGFEMQTFKKGGAICKKCVKKQAGGDFEGNAVDRFREEMKCGGKTKKPVKKGACGTKVKQEKCGGSVKEAKCGTKVMSDKCGGKTKKKLIKKACGGSVQKKKKQITKAKTGTDLPTAPSATKRYNKGTLEYVLHPGFDTESDTDLIITGPDGSTIRRKIVSYPSLLNKQNDIYGTDTTYIETPGHKFWVTPQPRIESSRSDGNLKTGKVKYYKTKDADLMKRRWEEAVSVSVDKRKK